MGGGLGPTGKVDETNRQGEVESQAWSEARRWGRGGITAYSCCAPYRDGRHPVSFRAQRPHEAASSCLSVAENSAVGK